MVKIILFAQFVQSIRLILLFHWL